VLSDAPPAVVPVSDEPPVVAALPLDELPPDEVPAVELPDVAASCVTAGLAVAGAALIIWVWVPCTVSVARLLAAMLAISPGCATKRARPSVDDTSTAPSTTCTDAPVSSTVTLNVVPLTTAAR